MRTEIPTITKDNKNNVEYYNYKHEQKKWPLFYHILSNLLIFLLNSCFHSFVYYAHLFIELYVYATLFEDIADSKVDVIKGLNRNIHFEKVYIVNISDQEIALSDSLIFILFWQLLMIVIQELHIKQN